MKWTIAHIIVGVYLAALLVAAWLVLGLPTAAILVCLNVPLYFQVYVTMKEGRLDDEHGTPVSPDAAVGETAEPQGDKGKRR